MPNSTSKKNLNISSGPYDLQAFKSLFNQVNALTEHYKRIDYITGENFNVFRIVGLESSEVKMHSALLAELLNPRGSHGRGDVFLKLFIEMFCFKGNLLDSGSCQVSVEKHAGLINGDYTYGGRIDIIIMDKCGHRIIIENKIHADDQFQQLVRYNNYDENADLIYLTLRGDEPSEESRGHLEEGLNYRCISYAHDIVTWLDQCRKEASIFPVLRESITQYMNLIKYLTNQTLNNAMEQELHAILLSNLKASFTVGQNLDNALEKLLKGFDIKLTEIAEKYKLTFKNRTYGAPFKYKFGGFWFDRPQEWRHVNIGFQFQDYDNDLVYGICVKKDPNTENIPEDLRKLLSARVSHTLKERDWWPIKFELEAPYNNWNNYEPWEAIENGVMASIIEQKIVALLGLVSDFEGMM